MNRQFSLAPRSRSSAALLLAVTLFALLMPTTLFARSTLIISKAKLSGNNFTLEGRLNTGETTVVDIYDGSGRPLGQTTVGADHHFTFSNADVDRPELLCSVRAATENASGSATVKGRDKACAKVPVCRILNPVGTLQASFNSDVLFKARASLKDASAKPLRME
jgi:hypothetical protein